MVVSIASKSPLDISEVPEHIVRAFKKCLNVFEAAIDDRKAHFGKEGYNEDHCKGCEHSEAHYKNKKKKNIAEKWKAFHTQWKEILKIFNLMGVRVSTLKASKSYIL